MIHYKWYGTYDESLSFIIYMSERLKNTEKTLLRKLDKAIINGDTKSLMDLQKTSTMFIYQMVSQNASITILKQLSNYLMNIEIFKDSEKMFANVSLQ